MADVSAAEAVELVHNGGFLLDVREAHEWFRGHSALASNIPMSQIGQRLDELPSDQRILVVCHLGGRSSRVCAALVDAGYDAVNVAGGMVGWQAAGGDVVSDGSEPPSVD
ncbi:MAG: hypothetical protein JWP30_598 [Homoserinimonas sp.]|jgi:rhodanese-related sulfurtransferase|nr:hypothetical protein [Homoserinimonas sp.]